ncbi:MAG: exodeoxyribonuclease III, partial [Prevotella sp.]|nr:exodeoxyribonuclease III [Prevotella sp.]
MKLVSWNVNGLRACVKPKTDDKGNVKSKGFETYFNELDADFFCLNETKLQEGQL